MTILQFIRNAFFGEPSEGKAQTGKQSVADSTQLKTSLTMKVLIEKIKQTTHDLMHDIEKFEQGNKAAGQRARKTSLELEKLYKEFRKRSVHESVEA